MNFFSRLIDSTIRHDNDIKFEVTQDQYKLAEEAGLTNGGMFGDVNGVKMFNLSFYKNF